MDLFSILTLIGGLALFLYGMNAMGDGLAKVSGGKLEKILENLTSNPIKAVLLGAGVTAVIQSSSATTVMVVGFVLLDKYPKVANRISEKFNKVWVFAEILLFVLVGAQVDVKVIVHSGLLGLLVLFIGLVARSIGVYISLMGSNLNLKEKIFCIISFMPKATVQAAMGAVPLASGVASGNLILAIAVLSIIVTAPLGAVGIKYFGDKWIS